MATYKIISDKTSLGKVGDHVRGNDLAGLNVAALIEGKHIELVVSSFTKRDKIEKKESE
jgi:hypothetical protein